jgi:hypothetical protein
LIGETRFEAFLMDLGFGPDEWLGVGIVGFNEVIDVVPELFDPALSPDHRFRRVP